MSYNVAVTSSDGARVDRHFNSAEQFTVLCVDEQSGEVLEETTRRLPHFQSPVSDDTDCGVHGGCHFQKRFAQIAALLSDCRYLLTLKIGKQPYAVLRARGIDALEVDSDIPEAVRALHRYYLRYHKIARA